MMAPVSCHDREMRSKIILITCEIATLETLTAGDVSISSNITVWERQRKNKIKPRENEHEWS